MESVLPSSSVRTRPKENFGKPSASVKGHGVKRSPGSLPLMQTRISRIPCDAHPVYIPLDTCDLYLCLLLVSERSSGCLLAFVCFKQRKSLSCSAHSPACGSLTCGTAAAEFKPLLCLTLCNVLFNLGDTPSYHIKLILFVSECEVQTGPRCLALKTSLGDRPAKVKTDLFLFLFFSICESH